MELSARTLENAWVRLEPLEEHHRAEMIAAAEADPTIFRHMPYMVEQFGFEPYFVWLLGEREAGRWIPHVIRTPDGPIVGQSCYLTIRERDAGVEIGGTWYRREMQGTSVNPAAKLALISNAFTWGVERVEFKTDALNAQSRAALLKLGATFEGIHRRHMKRPNGTWRDSAYFSIVREEWPAVSERIEARLAVFP